MELEFSGAGGRTRTGTVSPPVDFESTTSANSITPAHQISFTVCYHLTTLCIIQDSQLNVNPFLQKNFPPFSAGNFERSASIFIGTYFLFFQHKRFAVCTLIHRWIQFVRTNGDAVQRAVIFRNTVVFTLLYRTFDAWIGMFHIHSLKPPFR